MDTDRPRRDFEGEMRAPVHSSLFWKCSALQPDLRKRLGGIPAESERIPISRRALINLSAGAAR
jgi:hypothetical protein